MSTDEEDHRTVEDLRLPLLDVVALLDAAVELQDVVSVRGLRRDEKLVHEKLSALVGLAQKRAHTALDELADVVARSR